MQNSANIETKGMTQLTALNTSIGADDFVIGCFCCCLRHLRLATDNLPVFAH